MTANPERVGEHVRERRKHVRSLVGLPAIIDIKNVHHSGRLTNIAIEGALLESKAPVLPGAVLSLRCGSIAAKSTVIWTKGEQLGVRFHSPLSDRQVDEQRARSAAIAARQSRRADRVAACKLSNLGRSASNSS